MCEDRSAATLPHWFRVALALLLALALFLPAYAAAVAQSTAQPSGPQDDVASYGIQVTLDPAGKQIRGSERITYRNPSGDTLNEVWLRLYLNAFRSPNTQWMREAGGDHRGFQASAPGWVRVEQLAMAPNGPQLPLPGGNGDTEDTIVRVPLPAPLPPGQTVSFDVRWTAQLPEVFARTGYSDDFFMVGQWYPKLAVYDRGRWDTEPWHANAEFFADFGNYDLAVTVPGDYVTGASGVRVGEVDNGNGTKTVRYRAERVTDVAWTAWPGYQVFTRDVQAAGKATQIELLLPPEEAGNAERHIAAGTLALDSFGTSYGAYPWPKLTMVVPPRGAGGAGGMEYPTLVTTGTNGIAPGDFPPINYGIRGLETVTVHEIAHEWFPMQVQSNEGAEAWLDEGFADYLATRALGKRYGPDRSVADLGPLRLGYLSQQRGVMGATGSASEPLTQASWQFGSFTRYGGTVYAKGSLVLVSLENLLGEERFTKALRDYADRWRWRHPTTPDLQAALEESTGEDLDWFFSAYVYGSDVVNYHLATIDDTQAVVEREGEASYPVDVEVTYSDGSTRVQQWDGESGRLVIKADGKAIARVFVDPDGELVLELNRLDNARSDRPDPTPSYSIAGRWLALAQQLLQLLGQIG